VWCVGVGVGQAASLFVGVFVCGSVGERCCAGSGSLSLCRFVCVVVWCVGVGVGQAASLFVGVFVYGSVVRGCGCGPDSLPLCTCVCVW